MTHVKGERDAGIGQTGEIDGGARQCAPMKHLVGGT